MYRDNQLRLRYGRRVRSLPLDRKLCFSLNAATIAINRACEPRLDQLEIAYRQYPVLHELWEKDAHTVGGIAARLALVASTITPLAKRLAAGAARVGRPAA